MMARRYETSSTHIKDMTMKSRRLAPGATKYHSGGESVLNWKKSSWSYANGNCVQVAGLSDSVIRIRSSRDVNGPVLTFTAAKWDAFIAGVRNGEFDRT
jgi:predicted secreted Zn-dependent protease